MIVLCIDPGSKVSGLCIIQDGKVVYGQILENVVVYKDIPEWLRMKMQIDLVIIEMITLFGGQHKSATVSETLVVIGRIMQILTDKNIPFERISRQQVVAYFLKGKSDHADKKIQALMRESFSLGKARHPILKRDLWQAYALFKYAEAHKFEKWYVPNFGQKKKKEDRDPEKTKENKRKFLRRKIDQLERAYQQLG